MIPAIESRVSDTFVCGSGRPQQSSGAHLSDDGMPSEIAHAGSRENGDAARPDSLVGGERDPPGNAATPEVDPASNDPCGQITARLRRRRLRHRTCDGGRQKDWRARRVSHHFIAQISRSTDPIIRAFGPARPRRAQRGSSRLPLPCNTVKGVTLSHREDQCSVPCRFYRQTGDAGTCAFITRMSERDRRLSCCTAQA